MGVSWSDLWRGSLRSVRNKGLGVRNRLFGSVRVRLCEVDPDNVKGWIARAAGGIRCVTVTWIYASVLLFFGVVLCLVFVTKDSVFRTDCSAEELREGDECIYRMSPSL